MLLLVMRIMLFEWLLGMLCFLSSALPMQGTVDLSVQLFKAAVANLLFISTMVNCWCCYFCLLGAGWSLLHGLQCHTTGATQQRMS